MKTIKVSVTEEDISNGLRQNCNFCPVARAFRRHLREQSKILFMVDQTNIFLSNSAKFLPLPIEAQDFIAAFDGPGYLPSPIEFEMQLPDNEDWYYDVR